MAEKSNEELLDALETAISKVYGHDDMPAYHKARAAVLARMCGPGEVVVPKEPTAWMKISGCREAKAHGLTWTEPHDLVRDVFKEMCAEYAARVRAEERERCAMVVEGGAFGPCAEDVQAGAAAAIRALGDE